MDLGEPNVHQYYWVVVASGILAIFAAFGIGANDVANAFATSVGSGALTIKQAIFIAAIFEFLGSVLMGGHVVNTIRKGISKVECFEDRPDILMYGSMNVIIAVGLWLITASRFEIPVSTTHSAVGGMIGMTLTAVGSKCVNWSETSTTFPYQSGVSAIIISWILSPVLSGLCASALFFCVRKILRTQNPYENIWKFYPLLIGVTVTINSFFILWKGFKNASDQIDKLSIEVVMGISFGVGLFSSILSLPLIRKWKKETRVLEKSDKICDVNNLNIRNCSTEDILALDEKACNVHENAELFDKRAEEGLKKLQIFTSICDSFAHGANDVANAIGPFAAVYMTYKHNGVSKNADMGNDSYWILSIGGIGIVLGLLLYGYKIIQAIGMKLSKITPSRGICIELGSAIIVITGSRYGWPLSTTHCQVGATVAVALMEGRNGLNWTIFYKICIGWILTLVIVGGTTALFFAQGIYSPSIHEF
tara:strand:+ start:7765 stop:9198 length:1434 start_codon:yes stop_codon:yes gene_type:complete